MTRIRANRESVDDRFSVLGFTVNVDQPLYEIALATDPDLFKPENRARRSASNFHASPLQATRPRNDAVYLVPPSVVARFVGQPRIYFGVAAYADGDRSMPVSVRRPDAGTMYVSLRGLTERGLRRGTRGPAATGSGYGTAATAPAWGGDALSTREPAAQGATTPANPATYNDGYSDDLWRAPAGTDAPVDATAAASTPDAAAPATAQALRHAGNGATHRGDPRHAAAPHSHAEDYDDGYGAMPAMHRAPQAAQPPAARALRVVSSYYNPSDWLDALRTQLAFFASSAQWWAGVENTRVMPHSAICQVRVPDGSADGAGNGTAFFIAPNLLLTAAHVVEGFGELIIVPGKSGAGSAGEPFGRFHVTASDVVVHPRRVVGNPDFDMALIRVPAAHASSQHFDLVEELTESRPEGVVVSGYAAYSAPGGVVDHLVNATIDPDRQHLHGGYIRSLPSEETFDYDLQSLGGTSGSPVYYIEAGDAPRTHMVGVHVAGHSETTNLGCRITPAKLAWIRQQAAAWNQSLTFSLGARALSDEAASDEHVYDESERHESDEDSAEPVDAEAQALALHAAALTAPAPDYPGASRYVAAHANNFRRGRRRGTVVDRIVVHITAGAESIEGTLRWFQDGNRVNARTGRAILTSSHYVIGRDGEVVQMVRNADTAHHASNANARSIGIEHCANKPSRRNRRDLPPTMAQYQASAHLVAWLCAQYGLPIDRTHIVGHREADSVTDHDCPTSYWDWETYMQCVQLAAQALAGNSSTGVVPTTSQALRAPVRAQELITPYYDPSSPGTALQCTNDAFSQAREEWYVGVQDTSAFPHSAICYLRMTAPDGRASTGTGFYIGRNRILTCAHNLHGKSTVQIVPGRNGAGTAPFGEATIDSTQWRIAPRYTGVGDWDNDLAVIDNAPIEAPNGTFFRFLNATPGNAMPLAVCGYSSGSKLHRELGPVADRDLQHLHGGHARGQPTPDTIDYDILAIAGASGSPVYTVRDEGNGLEAFVCGVHVTRGSIEASGGPSVNRGCFITPAKLDWIEGRATSFAFGGARALSAEGVEHRVALVPQPDKNACWAASMAMLKSFRSNASFDPEAFVREAGGSLSTSYGWDQLERVRTHYRFEHVAQAPDASLYHAPTQWAQWLRDFGPLWVVIVGAPHAVVVSGIRGDLSNPAAVEVHVLNPWDTGTAFDNDPVIFNPPNRGHAGWMPFEAFAADFGAMAEPDYGNWRVLHLPAAAAAAQSLALPYRLAPAPMGRALSDAIGEPVEPSRVPGTRMRVVRGAAGASRWALDQLEGRKAPQAAAMPGTALQPTDVVIDLGEWPALEGQAAPVPLTVRFRSEADGSVGDVAIMAGTPAALGYGVDIVARIEDAADAEGVAALRVAIDVRFAGLAQGAPCARIDLRLLGNGRYERSNRWTDTSLAA